MHNLQFLHNSESISIIPDANVSSVEKEIEQRTIDNEHWIVHGLSSKVRRPVFKAYLDQQNNLL